MKNRFITTMFYVLAASTILLNSAYLFFADSIQKSGNKNDMRGKIVDKLIDVKKNNVYEIEKLGNKGMMIEEKERGKNSTSMILMDINGDFILDGIITDVDETPNINDFDHQDEEWQKSQKLYKELLLDIADNNSFTDLEKEYINNNASIENTYDNEENNTQSLLYEDNYSQLM
ncbi:MAG TPA: hypothetical protein DEP72_00685 [Clostridiales bacterium]|nr:MAG: hypothetical protein A2Y18_02895 [Clostridiales bacterium GWD2_32_19]HCC06668.1 hypothetical protein [Clostridiales bacterium]